MADNRNEDLVATTSAQMWWPPAVSVRLVTATAVTEVGVRAEVVVAVETGVDGGFLVEANDSCSLTLIDG